MKIKILSRNPEDYYRETVNDINKIHRNFEKTAHPMQAAREYARALNAVKLEKIFAKPFVRGLSGHSEPVTKIAAHPERLSWLASSSMDGIVKLWDLKTGNEIASKSAHDGMLNGLAFTFNGQILLTSGVDSKISMLRINDQSIFNNHEEIVSEFPLHSLDSLKNTSTTSSGFVVGGEGLAIYDVTRKNPLRTFVIENEIIHHVRCSKIEEFLFGVLGGDKGFSLYDSRQTEKCFKAFLDMRGNSFAWSPLEANFVVLASEDSNCYLFDMRNIKKPITIYEDHTNSVLDVDFNPTGQEFVSAAYDRSIRIYNINSKKSREVYHTKRMQRVFCARYTADAQYIACGSDEMNIRLWKTEASKPMGYVFYSFIVPT